MVYRPHRWQVARRSCKRTGLTGTKILHKPWADGAVSMATSVAMVRLFTTVGAGSCTPATAGPSHTTSLCKTCIANKTFQISISTPRTGKQSLQSGLKPKSIPLNIFVEMIDVTGGFSEIKASRTQTLAEVKGLWIDKRRSRNTDSWELRTPTDELRTEDQELRMEDQEFPQRT